MKTVQELTKVLPFETAMDSDLSAMWKLCGKGGAAKRKTHPCHICCIEDSRLETPNAQKCYRWCRLRTGDEDFKCYHQTFMDGPAIIKLREQLLTCQNELKLMLPELEDIRNASIINCREDPTGVKSKGQKGNTRSIHFDYEADTVTEDQKEQFGDDVTEDLLLCNCVGAGTLEQRVNRLRSRLTQEWVYVAINNSIIHAEKGADFAFLLMTDCVPCILHLENRTGLKLITIILQAGLTNTIKERLYKNVKGGNKKLMKYVKDVEDIFNSHIFGTAERRSNFHLPFNLDDKKFDDITMDNNRTRAIMMNCDRFINLCFITKKRKRNWISMVSKYNTMIRTLRSKQDFTNEMVETFQLQVDRFYNQYMEIIGRPGITNYFHMLGSGHISEFLLIYKNLYQHSQQGWEAFNSYLKVFYFRRTSRGGGRGDFNRVRQIARWLARRMVWMSGTTYDDIVKMNEANIMANESEESKMEDDDLSLELSVDSVDNLALIDF